MPGQRLLGPHFVPDLLASVVVFLVALPLCMGIAIASGVPPALGLVTGIIGGLVVGFIAGAPLQVSGPAAGLAVMVWELVQRHGLAALGVIVVLAGLIQVAAGLAKVGTWFRAVPPSVIHGMLAGIGVLIFAGQFHVMVDDKPRGSGLSNLLSIPSSVMKGIVPLDGSPHHLAAAVGVATILGIVLWGRLAPKKLKFLPGPLIGVVLATVAANLLELPIAYVKVPDNLIEAFNVPPGGAWALLANPAIYLSALAVAVIASAETLLCATAVDRMHHGERTRFDRELIAQGVGNTLCGALGALPMTGVIVRSAANVEAGAKTRRSAILHGAWLLVLVVAAPRLLALMPVSALAAVLVFTGAKLMDQKIGGVRALPALLKDGRMELITYLATIVGIVSLDLLRGVLLGLALAIGKILHRLARPRVRLEGVGDQKVLRMVGELTFVQLPRLGAMLGDIPPGSSVRVDAEHVDYIDHACLEELSAWERLHTARGGSAAIDWQHLKQVRDSLPL